MQAPSAPTLSTMRTTTRPKRTTHRHATTALHHDTDTITNTPHTSTLHTTRYPRSLSHAARLRDIYGIDTYSTGQHENAEILSAAKGLTTMRNPGMASDFAAKSVLENLHLAPKMTFSNRWEKVFPSYEEEMEAMDSGDEGDSVGSPSSPEEEEESEDDEEDIRSDFGDKNGRERYMAIWELRERWWREEREIHTDDDEGYETIPDSEPDSDEEVEKPKIDPVELRERERVHFAKQRRRLQADYAAILVGMRGDEEPEPERKRATQSPSSNEEPVTNAPGPGAMTPLPSDRQHAPAATWTEEPAPTTNGRKRASEEEEKEKEAAPPKKRAKTKRVPTKRAATAKPSAPANTGNRRCRSKPVPALRNEANGTQPVYPSPLRQSTSTSDKEAEDARLMPPPARPNGRSANGGRHARPSTNGNGKGNRTPASAAPPANGAVGEDQPSEPVRTRSGRVSKKTAKASGSGSGGG